jgi:hypothetical protein
MTVSIKIKNAQNQRLVHGYFSHVSKPPFRGIIDLRFGSNPKTSRVLAYG